VGELVTQTWDRGWAHFQREEYVQAIACFREAIAIDPDHAVSHWGLATALFEDDEFDESESEFRRALELKDLTLAWAGLAFLYHSTGRLELAEQTHLEAMRLKPDNRDRVESYADFLWDVGRQDEARVEYMRATQLYPAMRWDWQ
jgi:Tfp pilus assembly protein PilF